VVERAHAEGERRSCSRMQPLSEYYSSDLNPVSVRDLVRLVFLLVPMGLEDFFNGNTSIIVRLNLSAGLSAMV